MPNKYQREIEEILRNMEGAQPRTGVGDRVRQFNRPRPRYTPSYRLSLTRTEFLFVVGILLALLAAGITFYKQGDQILIAGVVPLQGILGLMAFAFIVVGLALEWRDRFRGVTTMPLSGPIWPRRKGSESNVVSMTPRRGPMSAIATQVRILRLKFRYLRKRGQD